MKCKNNIKRDYKMIGYFILEHSLFALGLRPWAIMKCSRINTQSLIILLFTLALLNYPRRCIGPPLKCQVNNSLLYPGLLISVFKRNNDLAIRSPRLSLGPLIEPGHYSYIRYWSGIFEIYRCILIEQY